MERAFRDVQPLVTVICLCYNHVKFVREALQSVLAQTYPNLQIVVVDDASTDGSVTEIGRISKANPDIQFLPLETNVGNCRAFNRGLALVKGEYVVDFSTDDVMHPDRIAKQVTYFINAGAETGVVFTDAVYIDETGKPIRQHYPYLKKKRLLKSVPRGDIYSAVISTYFICGPTMLVKRKVFDELGGYDESLAYEDFDFWVRSARTFRYGFVDEPLTYVRLRPDSLSRKAYKPGDRQVHSTYLVCLKIRNLNRTTAEDRALSHRLKFEIRQCVMSGNNDEAKLFYKLLKEVGSADAGTIFFMALNRLRLPLFFLRAWYHRVRFH